MTQQLVGYTCQICGGALESKGDGVYVCRYCGRRWEEERVDDYEKIFETVEAALREQRRADLAALAKLRYEETHKEFVSNMELKGICHQILALNPDDFYARFYLATCKEDSSLEEFLLSMDIEKHYYDIEDMLGYLIRSLQARWINAVSMLIENTYKDKDIEKYHLYRTRFEEMAGDVEEGIFEPMLPRDVFVAYSSKDMKKVNELLRVLEDENGIFCFVAARNLRHGGGAAENYRSAITTALHNCRAVVFVSSVSSRSVKCEAASELNYIQNNLPKMRRIELLTENYKGIPVERIFTSFFDGLEYCTSPQEVASRYFDNFMLPEQDDVSRLKAEEARIEKQKAEAVQRRKTEEARIVRQKAEAKHKDAEERKKKLMAKLRSKKAIGAFIASVSCIFVLVAAVGGIFLFSGSEKTPSNTTPSSTLGTSRPGNATAATSSSTSAASTTSSTTSTSDVLPAPDFVIENGVLTKYNGSSKNVTIPNDVTSIGASAFLNCSNISKITIPEGVISIGDYAFSYCGNLTSITVPNSVSSIGKSAFAGCGELTNITIPDGIISIGNYTFSYCAKLESITMPSSLETICTGAFYGCGALTSIELPESVTTIGKNAFYGCGGLTSVTIPEGVTTIEEKVFYGCISLANIEIRGNVTTIGTSAFEGCENLTGITIPESVTTIAESAFALCNSLTSLVIPNGVTSIGNHAFSLCIGLTSIELPESITTIGDHLFYGCSSLTSITIPEGVTTIGAYTFYECGVLPNIELPKGITTISKGAFAGCGKLTNITIPESVIIIDENVFAYCNDMETIYCEATAKPTRWNAGWLNSCQAQVVWGYNG